MMDIVTISDDESNHGQSPEEQNVHPEMTTSMKLGQIADNKDELKMDEEICASDGKTPTCDGGRCPLCQVPFSVLIADSPSWHMNECLRVNRSTQKECPKAHGCDSPIASHYARFTHYAVARRESNDYAESDFEIPNPLEVVEAIYNGCSEEEKEISLSPSKNLISPKRGRNGFVKGQPKITSFFKMDGPPKPSNPNLKDQFKITSFFHSDNLKKSPTFNKSNKVQNEKQKFTPNTPQETNSTHEEFSFSENGVSRKCPFYKKLPDVPIVVDAFNYGDIPGVFAYFLSHFHSDHYYGLKKSFRHILYCTKITANLVKLKIGVDASRIRILSYDEPTVVYGVLVDIIEAFHCPGAVMFCLRYTDGRTILHTGDFRANDNMQLHPLLKNMRCDILYLDTTYCQPVYEFPSQDSTVDFVIQTARRHLSNQRDVLFVCGAYCIGKEKVFIGIAKALNLKVCGSKDKIQVLHCLEDEDINNCVTTDWKSAAIHVLPMGQLDPASLKRHLAKYKGIFSSLVAFKPTGWEMDKNGSDLNAIKPKYYGSVAIYGVPYSEHSSFSELRKFVKFIKPARIIPTVNVGTSKIAQDQLVILKSWYT